MNNKPSLGLGKGLGALISDAADFNPVGKAKAVSSETGSGNGTEIMAIPIDKIDTNPYQPRQVFDEAALEELAESIRQLGLIQPVTVRKTGDRYQIISGERRFRASKMAGLMTMPAYIRTTDDKGMLEMAIVENIQRENLDAIEVAMSFQRLIDECSLTQEQMADRVGKKRATVTNYLRLLKLPAEIQLSIRAGKLSMGHAKVLLSVDDQDAQLQLCDAVIEKDLSVRQLEKKIAASASKKEDSGPEESKAIPEQYFKVTEILGRFFDNNVNFKRAETGKGTITIHFSNDEEVGKFLKKMEDAGL